MSKWQINDHKTSITFDDEEKRVDAVEWIADLLSIELENNLRVLELLSLFFAHQFLLRNFSRAALLLFKSNKHWGDFKSRKIFYMWQWQKRRKTKATTIVWVKYLRTICGRRILSSLLHSAKSRAEAKIKAPLNFWTGMSLRLSMRMRYFRHIVVHAHI